MLEPTGTTGKYTYDPSVPAGTGGGGGSGSGALVIVDDGEKLSLTWQEIEDAIKGGEFAVITFYDTTTESWMYIYIVSVGFNTLTNKYSITTQAGDSYEADTPNDYPAMSDSGDLA